MVVKYENAIIRSHGQRIQRKEMVACARIPLLSRLEMVIRIENFNKHHQQGIPPTLYLLLSNNEGLWACTISGFTSIVNHRLYKRWENVIINCSYYFGVYIGLTTVEISPSPVAPVCQEGDQLELTCTSSGTVHRWEFTVFPENITHRTVPVTLAGTSGVPPPLTVSSSMITFSRLSGQDSLPLISRITIATVSRGLNRTVVNCLEGISSTDSVATTTIRIIDPDQLGKKVLFLDSEKI